MQIKIRDSVAEKITDMFRAAQKIDEFDPEYQTWFIEWVVRRMLERELRTGELAEKWTDYRGQ